MRQKFATVNPCKHGFAMMLLIIAAVCIQTMGGETAKAGDELQAGISAYERGDYDKSLKILQPLAENGDHYAQSYVGAMHLHGQGTEKDYTKALKWNRKAAEAGLAGAQHMLGQMYWSGLGVGQSYDEAAKWYQRSADQGLAEAEFSLGYMYSKG